MMRDMTKVNCFAIVMLVIALSFLSLPNIFAVDQHDDTNHDKLTQDRTQPDQTSSSSHESFDPFGTVTRLAQTFQASVTKDITRVDLCLKRVGSPQGNIWVEIFTCTTLAPTEILTFGTDGREARSGKVSVSAVSTDDYDFVSFILPKGIDLISGTGGSRYAIVLCGDYDADVSNYIGWYYKDWSTTDGFLYAGAYYYNGSWSDWDPSPFRDFSFTTYYGETNEIVLDQLSIGAGSFSIPSGWEIFTSTTLASDATYVDFTGLDSNTDMFYVLFMFAKNNTASDSLITLLVNSDTTPTNYYSQNFWMGSTSSAASRNNDSRMAYMPGSSCTSAIVTIYKDAGDYFRFHSSENRGVGSSISAQLWWGTKTAALSSPANITSLRVNSSYAFASGSKFMLAKGRVK